MSTGDDLALAQPRTGDVGGIKQQKITFCLALAALASPVVVLVALLRWPAPFIELSNQLSWRVQWPSLLQAQLEQTLFSLQVRGDALVKPEDTLLFGDSHLHALPGSTLAHSVNYAIGGETASNLANRIGKYRSLHRVRQVVILTGRNDLAKKATTVEITRSMASVLVQIPPTVGVVVLGIPPANENSNLISQRRNINIEFQRLCASRPLCKFSDLESLADNNGRLRIEFDAGDGIHLNESGNQILIAKIEEGTK